MSDRKSMINRKVKEYSYVLILLGILIAMILIISMASPYFFLENCRNILNQSAIYLVISVGMTLVISAGQIDLSVGSVIGFSGMVMGMIEPEWSSAWSGYFCGASFFLFDRNFEWGIGCIWKNEFLYRDIKYDDDCQGSHFDIDKFPICIWLWNSLYFYRKRSGRAGKYADRNLVDSRV